MRTTSSFMSMIQGRNLTWAQATGKRQPKRLNRSGPTSEVGKCGAAKQLTPEQAEERRLRSEATALRARARADAAKAAKAKADREQFEADMADPTVHKCEAPGCGRPAPYSLGCSGTCMEAILAYTRRHSRAP